MPTTTDPAESPSQGTDGSPPADTTAQTAPRSNNDVPKPKRLACMICRKRKLRCDGIKPSCSTCTRLGHSCAYDEVRKKSGPKRGYVKALEERLKQVEELLKTQEPSSSASPETTKTPNVTFEPTRNHQTNTPAGFNVANPSIGISGERDIDRWRFNGESPQGNGLDEFNFTSNMPINMNSMDPSFTWEMIGLGLEEPLPPQETIDELHQIYFEKIHPSVPMIHKFRYLAAMNLAPSQRPPVALRYAIWTLACSLTDKYKDLKELFYQRSRKYVEADAIKGYGEHSITIAHCQTHVLLASYEFKMMYFPRAWMSTGAAVRLAQMIGLHRIDGNGLDVKQCLPPPRDWTEREERRRTFWMAFCQDRYASIGTGWPMTVDERDIMTNLPASEEAFNLSRPEQTQTLSDAMTPAGPAKLSAFGGIVLMASLFGRNLTHLHRPDVDDRDHDMNGEFWKRHRLLDNILLNTSLCLPNHLKLPTGLNNPNIVFTNMNIHTSTICLHQAAIFKADKNVLPPTVSAESKVRCITAANEIASIMRMTSHLDISAMNPFVSFCLYVAARVFVQYLKSRPDDCQTADSLRFLLAAMNALKKKNPLTESFLVQLDVDLEALGMRIPKLKSAFPRSTDSPAPKSNVAHYQPKSDGTNHRTGVEAVFDEVGCNFMTYEKTDAIDASELIEPERRNQGNNSSQGNQFGTQQWYSGERQIPSRERVIGPDDAVNGVIIPPMIFTSYGEAQGSDANDMSVSSNPDAQSNRPTPNSSSNASEQRRSVASTGAMAPSNGASFNTSPIGSQQNLGAQGAEMDASRAPFFPDHGFVGMTPGRAFAIPDTPSNDFSMSAAWENGQAGMTPRTAEAIIQGLNMSMDGVEMNWDAGT
ncbi:fungal-specific transcription factor domain-containing protein [Xylaria bambusicola]|uniref:fungal-specific transcription factor domain-containing protein n=1 Tax=Xylaria bambusicola TaxID=326684 RepID=UPI00200846BF|nr:fungal-specific transcription factor domain-containing protein [Xylaria bambusicola]KAI0508508.1 fungal-specific transcription factor domain-containing protein [Xylaria bambusicola]